MIIFFEWLDSLVKILFFFFPSILKTFSLSLLVLSIGAMCDNFKMSAKIIKWVIYLIYFLYVLWFYGIIQNILT